MRMGISPPGIASRSASPSGCLISHSTMRSTGNRQAYPCRMFVAGEAPRPSTNNGRRNSPCRRPYERKTRGRGQRRRGKGRCCRTNRTQAVAGQGSVVGGARVERWRPAAGGVHGLRPPMTRRLQAAVEMCGDWGDGGERGRGCGSRRRNEAKPLDHRQPGSRGLRIRLVSNRSVFQRIENRRLRCRFFPGSSSVYTDSQIDDLIDNGDSQAVVPVEAASRRPTAAPAGQPPAADAQPSNPPPASPVAGPPAIPSVLGALRCGAVLVLRGSGESLP
jgi:hypothetical protein